MDLDVAPSIAAAVTAAGTVIAALAPILFGALGQPAALRRMEMLNKVITESGGDKNVLRELSHVREHLAKEYRKKFDRAGASTWQHYGWTYLITNASLILLTLIHHGFDLSRLAQSPWGPGTLISLCILILSVLAIVRSKELSRLSKDRTK